MQLSSPVQCTCVRARETVQGLRVDNAAALQLQVTKIQTEFLSTLPNRGTAQFLTVLKPCGILLPHVHQRASEVYSILTGAPQPLFLDWA
jgi:hypothetical protein